MSRIAAMIRKPSSVRTGLRLQSRRELGAVVAASGEA
jgi:hypothetical protein